MVEPRLVSVAVETIALSLLLSAGAGVVTVAVQVRRDRDAVRACCRAVCLPLVVGPGLVGLFLLAYSLLLLLLELLVSVLLSVPLFVAEVVGVGPGPRRFLRGLVSHAVQIAVPGAILAGTAVVALAALVRTLGSPLPARPGKA